MKKILNILFATFLITGFLGCAPQEDDSMSLGNPPAENQLDFEFKPSTGKENIIAFKNLSKISGVINWDFGNGVTTNGESVTCPYPYKGDYTVKMTLYAKGGATSITKVVSIAKNDFSLINTPNYTALTGGAAKPEGKTWVFDEYHPGHFGVGPVGNSWPEWYSAPAEAKKGTSLYTQELTFIQDGTKLIWKNNGYVFTNGAGKNALGGDFIEYPAEFPDYDVKYTPRSSYTFFLNEGDMMLTLSDKAFVGHYAGASVYKVLKLTENELYLRCVSSVEPANAWYYRFIPKENNVKPFVPVRAVPLFEDFEKATPSVNFVGQDMGTAFSLSYSNPWPYPLNSSLKVCSYQKTDAMYTNLSFTAPTYKFDLKQQSKIRMKVYIPSKNDYDTEYDVDGPWVTNKKLLPQVAVKLQNGESSTPWEGQAEIIKGDLVKNDWISLEFDFGAYKDRTDFNKIVIQFGGEGHKGPGLFFLDDFSFDK